jgi:hypothetical protein
VRGVVALQLPQREDGGVDVLDRAIELDQGIGVGLADLPHQRLRDLLAQRLGLAGERLDRRDALLDRGARPVAAAAVPGRDGRVERREAFRGVRLRRGTEAELREAVRVVAHADRRADLLRRALPQLQLAAADQPQPDVARGVTPALGDVAELGERARQRG